jgi:hypothetical protein
MSGETRTNLRLREVQTYRIKRRVRPAQDPVDEPSLFDNYNQYVEHCQESGIAVRFSEAKFIVFKSREK